MLMVGAIHFCGLDELVTIAARQLRLRPMDPVHAAIHASGCARRGLRSALAEFRTA
jgi:hypothetical protein